jgi:flagellar biosynthesis protein FlhG
MIDQAALLRQRVKKTGVNTPVQAASLRRTRSCRSIAVTGGKGGVGKSNISLLLAQSLARLKKRVLLFDADLGLANIHILLGLNPRYNLSHAIRGECEFKQALCEGPDGITVLPGASGIEAMANIDALSMEMLLRELVEIEAGYDYLIVDIGAGVGLLSIRLASAADSALLVLTPDPASLADAYATAKILFSHEIQSISVLVNMAASENEGRDIFEKINTLTVNFLKRKVALAAVLPYDKDVPRILRAQQNFLHSRPSSVVAMRIGVYARTLCGMPAARTGFFARFLANREITGK